MITRCPYCNELIDADNIDRIIEDNEVIGCKENDIWTSCEECRFDFETNECNNYRKENDCENVTAGELL